MKTEMRVIAGGGTITAIRVRVGQPVEADAIVAELNIEETP